MIKKQKLIPHQNGSLFLHAFTLIELLVVVAIIGILATVVVVNISSSQNKARYAKATSDLKQVEKAIIIARNLSGKTLYGITGCNGSDFGGDCGFYCRNGDELAICLAVWNNIMDKIGIAANDNNLVASFINIKDPWNYPYAIDENEQELICPDLKPRRDGLKSYGPDNKYNADGNYGCFDDADNGDDVIIAVPLSGLGN